MGEVSDHVRQYLTGALDFDQLQEFLLGYAFLDPWRGHDLPDELAARNAYQDDHLPDVEDTLMELSRAVPDLGLTWPDYLRLLTALSEQAWEGGP